MGWIVPVALMGGLVGLTSFLTRAGRRVKKFPWVAASEGWEYSKLLLGPSPGEDWASPEAGPNLRTYVFSGEVDGAQFLTYECQSRVQGKVTAQGIGLHYVMVLVPTPARTPVLDIFPTNWASRVAEAIGTDASTELESDAFNARFQVVAAERQLAVDVLRPEVMDLLMADDAMACRIHDGVLALRYHGKHDVRLIKPRVRVAQQLRDEVPDWVWQRWDRPEETDS